MRGVLHADVKSCERPSETVDCVGDYAMAERHVFIDAAIGVDKDFIDLRLEAGQHVRNHGFAPK